MIEGKKTYITAAVAIVTAIAAYYVDGIDLATTVQSVFAAITAATIRSGITSEAKK